MGRIVRVFNGWVFLRFVVLSILSFSVLRFYSMRLFLFFGADRVQSSCYSP